MSGHSHWAGIKHKKAMTDAKRASVFTKFGRLITIAAREGGGNPDSNWKLKLAMDQARSANMPKENIERAIKRGTGELKDQAEISEVIYESYGPGGIMMVIKTLTDNKNRTVGEVKAILGKFEGKMSGPGSVMWNFEMSGMEYKPKNKLEASEEIKMKYEKLLEALNEQDDVQEIYDNL